MISVVIPACNEASVIGRALDALHEAQTRMDIVVVCNGCTDGTADRARQHAALPRVLEFPNGSKHLALMEGDRVSYGYPRFYVDADVIISGRDIETLASCFSDCVLAVGPARRIDATHSGLLVRAYFRFWELLPTVATGLFGRGVIGVSERGGARLRNRPDLMGDDTYIDTQFTDSERKIVSAAVSHVIAPRTTFDLLRRRIRASQGNHEIDGLLPATRSRVGIGEVRQVVLANPRRGLDAAVFVLVSMLGRTLGHRRRSREWLRDESSRRVADGD